MDADLDSQRLITFTEHNNILLNMVLRHNPHLLDSSFSPLITIPKCRQLLHFDIKRSFFKHSLVRLKRKRSNNNSTSPIGSLRIAVRRQRVFDESFQSLRYKSADEMRRKLSVTFIGEDGMDAGIFEYIKFYVLMYRIQGGLRASGIPSLRVKFSTQTMLYLFQQEME
jgi:hypothetical protein